jgi:integrase
MPKTLQVPSPVLHKTSGQAVVTLRSPDGKRRQVYLGEFGSPEAAKRYREVIALHLAGTVTTTAEIKAAPAAAWPTVSRLVADFLLHAQTHYRDAAGKLSREVDNFTIAAAPFLDVLRDRRTDTLTCADLEAVRQHWGAVEFGQKRDEAGKVIAGTGKLHCRRYVNATLGRVRFILRWGTAQGIVPGPVWATLSAFRSLGRGRGGLRESEPVEAVPRAAVDAILPHLPATIAAAVELLWWSGMRAGELCNLRMRDVERAGEVWLYRPAEHKGAWKGRARTVRFGPKCQDILRPRVKANPDAFLFTPRDAMVERKAAWRAARKSPLQPSQVERDKRNAGKVTTYAEQFDVATLRRAVHRACDDAGVERFGLHRLRHAAGTRLVLAAGDEAARLQLGHADLAMVRRYSRAADNVAGAAVAVRHA